MDFPLAYHSQICIFNILQIAQPQISMQELQD